MRVAMGILLLSLAASGSRRRGGRASRSSGKVIASGRYVGFYREASGLERGVGFRL